MGSNWVIRKENTNKYFGWETNYGPAWVSLTEAHRFFKKQEAIESISVPVAVELCEIDSDFNIIKIEKY